MNKSARNKVLPLQQEPERKKKPSPRSKRKWNIRNLFLFAFLTWAGYVFFFVQAPDIDRLKQEQQKLGTEIQQMKVTNQDLKAKIEQLNDPDYIAELARKKYLMVKDGETLFVQPKQ
ncbi:cell division protein DivIC [Tumebacillus sp. BK434]|uniref:FtsB family cell division protein n=1 Tax=Tumebacillus sp. BK434 TaxID=2512169 RepID=UPI001048C13F|nr:septum formation initiator family protein [Tumebacillus sp. BK434]TCP52725.1 cell division protein DivIC [Tumebacillus sp. BK434]